MPLKPASWNVGMFGRVGERVSDDCARKRKRLVLEMRHHRRRPEARDRHMRGDQVVHRLTGATIRHVIELHARLLQEPFAEEVLVRAHARRRVALAAVLLHRVDEFLQRVDLQRRMHRPHQRLARDEDHRHQILVVVAVHLQDLRRAGDVVVGEQHRVAVGRALGDGLDADRAAGAGPVLDHQSAGRARATPARRSAAPGSRCRRRRRA